MTYGTYLKGREGWREQLSPVTDLHPEIGGEGQADSATCFPASVSGLYFLYRYEP